MFFLTETLNRIHLEDFIGLRFSSSAVDSPSLEYLQ